MVRFSTRVLFCLISSLCILVSSAQAPANDNCSGAINISAAINSGTCTSYSTANATASTTAACDACGTNDDVWFVFTATATGAISLNMTHNATYDPNVDIYTGTCASLTQTTCSNWNGDGTGTNQIKNVSFSVAAGTTYYVQVDGDCSVEPTICLSIDFHVVPDLICNAQQLTVNGGCLQGSNTGATNTGDPAPSCFTTSNSSWYYFTATDDSMSVSTDFASTGQLSLSSTNVAVFSTSNNACNGTLTQVGCATGNGTGCTTCSVVSMTGLVVGNRYYVLVDGASTTTGVFCISVYETMPPAPTFGSSCTYAHQMYPNTTCTAASGSASNATANWGTAGSVDQSCTGANDASDAGYWVKFTANSTTTTIDPVDFTGAQTTNWFDLTVYSGTCGSLTQLDCRSVDSKSNSYTIATTVGTEYYVFVTNGSSYAGQIRDICIIGAACTAPTTNSCSSPLSVMDGIPYTLTNACATADEALCSGSTENNIWASWTAPATWEADSAAFLVVNNQDCTTNNGTTASSGTQLSVYNSTETCATITGGTSECIVYNNPNNDNNFYANFIPVAGQTYLVNIDGFGGDACTFNFQINDQAPLTVLPVELANFQGIYSTEGDFSTLTWETLSESNNSHFIVEHSDNGVVFAEIGIVEGAITSVAPKYYSFKHEDPSKGVNYYRLRMVETNGRETFSKIIILKTQAQIYNTAVVPNPSNGNFNYQFNVHVKGQYTVSLVDISGKTLISKTDKFSEGRQSISFSEQSLPKGMYFLKVNNAANESLDQKKIVITNGTN